MTAQYDTPEQIAAFDVYIKQNPDGRQVHHTGTLGYEEDEWSAFQAGWNAAAQAEREACAKVCDEVAETHGDADECATEIRARGEL
jgi:hypothetical protein